jgi:hypothetical protein
MVPNYVPGVGSLATSRYDFEQHITGAKFRHTADQIDLTSPLVIDGYTATTVEQALITINNDLNPVIPQATTTSLGIIKLAGNLGGTALLPKVVAIQNIAISTAVPTTNQVLTYNGSAWSPATPSLNATSLQSTPVAATTPTLGKFLVYNGSSWTPSSLTGDITGTANATVITSIEASPNPVIVTAFLAIGSGGSINVGAGGIINVETLGQLNITGAGALTLTQPQDFVQYSTPHTRTVWNTFTVLNYDATNWTNFWGNNSSYAWQSKSVSGELLPILFKLDTLHNGASLISINVSFVTSTHSAVPTALPSVAIYRVALNSNSNSPTELSSTGGSPTPGSNVSIYNNSGNPQKFTLTLSGSGSDNVIDTSTYVYFLTIFDESGSNSVIGNTYYGYSVTYGNIISDQFP